MMEAILTRTTTIEARIARLFRMDDTAWARHANPWSVWTRMATLPLLILAFWSRAWIGWWSLGPVIAVFAWTWLNPRIFPPPRSTDGWAAKAVLGERVWLNRGNVPVPQHHRVWPNVLSLIAAGGMVLVVWGVALLAVWPTLLGAAISVLGKLWFVDRMVWLYEDMKEASPDDRRWLY